MDIIKKIEASLKKASGLYFFTTADYDKQPPAMVLIFDDPKDGAEGYDLLLEHCKGKKTLLVLSQKDGKADITIEIKDTNEKVNIKKLKVQQSQLLDFITKEPKDRKFVFGFGLIVKDQVSVLSTREQFSPVLIDAYEVKNAPQLNLF